MFQQTLGNPTAPDSIVVRSPLPGGVAAVVRYLFNLPAWFQIAGAIAGVLVAIALLIFVWLRRRTLLAWLRSRSHKTLVALGGVAAVAGAAAIAFGAVSWNYTQHNNDFCAACHVMNPAYSAFQISGHSTLQCHACHEQSIFASVLQVYYWVAERPQSIPPHAKVPNQVCARCHVLAHPHAIWQRITATAGHSVHLNSDSGSLRNIQCVTCHGVEIHHFAPLDRTCAQAGCHDNIRIRLGTMAAQTDLHCTGCHSFIAPVAEHISRDSAAAVMVPAGPQCLACHPMQQVIKDFDVTRDPHHGRCGWCHDPHLQTTPQAAFATCTNAGCHSQPATLTPLHRGISASALAACGTCHAAHTWTVQSTACIACHRDIYAPGHTGKYVAPPPPAPANASARVALVRFARLARTVAHWVGASGEAAPSRADSLPPFSHALHRTVGCTTCHNSAHSHGELTLHSARDCMACHHAADQHVECATCHAPATLPSSPGVPTTMAMSVWPAPRTRSLPFAHAAHTTVACRTCHTAPVTLALQERTCASCHADHHTAATSCLTCHTPSPKANHTRAAHLGCGGSGCHTDAAVLALAPARNVCLVCHQTLVTHKPGRECAKCHEVAWHPVAAPPTPN